MIDGSEAAMAAQLSQASAVGQRAARFSLPQQITVSLLWFALFANWLTVVPVIVPDQVAAILGPDAAAKEGIAGSILAIGALMALIMAPLAGALSDRARGMKGRRRPFLITGMIGTCVGLAFLVPFGPGSSVFLYLLAILNLQFAWARRRRVGHLAQRQHLGTAKCLAHHRLHRLPSACPADAKL